MHNFEENTSIFNFFTCQKLAFATCRYFSNDIFGSIIT